MYTGSTQVSTKSKGTGADNTCIDKVSIRFHIITTIGVDEPL